MKNLTVCFLFLSVFLSISCGAGGSCVVGEDKKNNCEALNTFQLPDSSQSLTFTHHCSKEKLSLSGYWQSYALFEYQDRDKKAVAVGRVEAGFIRGIQQTKGVRLGLEKIQVQSFSSWVNHNLDLALQLVNLETQQSFTGEFVSTYVEGKMGTGTVGVKNYQIASNGNLVWEKFIEPELQTKEQKGLTKIPEESPNIIPQNIDALKASHRLHLLIKNQNTGEILTLVGPVVENLQENFKLKTPESGVLGFWATINPFQKGGLWDFLGSAFEYKDCIYLRKQSKYELNKRFQ